MLVGKVFLIVLAVDKGLILPIDDFRNFWYSFSEVGDEIHADIGKENRENESVYNRLKLKISWFFLVTEM